MTSLSQDGGTGHIGFRPTFEIEINEEDDQDLPKLLLQACSMQFFVCESLSDLFRLFSSLFDQIKFNVPSNGSVSGTSLYSPILDCS